MVYPISADSELLDRDSLRIGALSAREGHPEAVHLHILVQDTLLLRKAVQHRLQHVKVYCSHLHKQNVQPAISIKKCNNKTTIKTYFSLNSNDLK